MAQKKLKFQDAMKRLDEIVNMLNQNDLDLEEAMFLFEEGLKLSKQCSKQLKTFEDRMDQLLDQQEETEDEQQ